MSQEAENDNEMGLRVNLLLFKEVDPELFQAVESVSKRKRGDYIRTLLSIGYAVKNGGQGFDLRVGKSTETSSKPKKTVGKDSQVVADKVAVGEKSEGDFEHTKNINVDIFA